MLEGFPDIHVEIVNLVAEDDLVSVHLHATGTHRGTSQGIEPTGAPVEVSAMDVIRVRDGQIVEEWQLIDSLGMLQQLGPIPA